MRHYLPESDLIYKNIQTDSNKRVVFLSGLGLGIRQQREGFFRRYALSQGVSYLALDYTRYVMNSQNEPDFNIEKTLPKTLEILAQDDKKLFLFGPCYGGLMALKIAAHIPEQIAAAIVFSPPHETEDFPWIERTHQFLLKRETDLAKRNVDPEMLKKMALFRQIYMTATRIQSREKLPTTFHGPVHIIHGQNDRLIPAENSIHVQRVLQNPNCVLHITPVAGHGMQNDFKMEVPIRILDKYLSHS